MNHPKNATSSGTVLLINPVYNKKATLGPFTKYITSQLPLSIGFLAGYILDKGIPVHVEDEQLAQLTDEYLESIIAKYSPRIVGMTVYTLTAPRAYELGRKIKSKWPDIKVVMGGVHVTLMPEEPLELGAADFVVRNEGEITFYELITHLNANQSVEGIDGLSFQKDGAVVRNPERALISNLDDLPMFPYHLFEKNIKEYQFGNMLTSRGCPYNCIFCSQKSISGQQYRSRSPKRVVEELDILANKYNQDFVFFNNDNFIVNENLCYEICDLIISRNYPKNFKIAINARGDAVTKKLLSRMREAHFMTIIFGLETGSERIMKLVKKGETVAEIEKGVRIAKKCGFIVSGQFILGFPTETRAESFQTIWHALRLPLDFTRFNLLVPYPGSEIFDMAKADKKINLDWSNYASHSALTGKTIPYIPDGRTAKDLARLQWFGNMAFFFRPRQLFNINKIRYGTAGQVILPDIYSFKGMAEMIGFAFKLVFFMLKQQLTIKFSGNHLTNDRHFGEK